MTKKLKPVYLAQSQAAFINSVSSEEADKLLVAMMANQTETKLGLNRQRGKTGWHTLEVRTKELEDLMARLVAKQDWIDVAIVAGMLLIREQMGV